MGKVIQLHTEMTEEEFFAAWKKECDEWERIASDMLERSRGTVVTAWDVSSQQRYRMEMRGEKPLDVKRIMITGKGWLIPR